jgi:hypothetical protein
MDGAAVVGLAIALAALVVSLVTLGSVIRRERAAPALTSGGARQVELERRLAQLSQRLGVVESDVDAQRGGGTGPRSASGTFRTAGVAISHIGLVRFDAFDDTGGAQSFALALIDDDGDGVLLTSLHSRQATRVYVKSIRRGVSDTPLSREEVQAMQSAGIPPTV